MSDSEEEASDADEKLATSDSEEEATFFPSRCEDACNGEHAQRGSRQFLSNPSFHVFSLVAALLCGMGIGGFWKPQTFCRGSHAESLCGSSLFVGLGSTFPRNTFGQLFPAYVNQSQFEIIYDTVSPAFCAAIQNIASNPGMKLFGDRGFAEPGYGGINSFGVLQVKSGVDVYLYGTRRDPKHLISSPWYCDGSSLDVSLLKYSNDRVAICWERTLVVKCLMKPGVTVVAGSGAWRNTSIGGCSLNADDGIAAVQAPNPKYLQFIFDHEASASQCWFYELDASNLWSSLQGNAVQFWPPLS